jgi:hypothetical protein
MYHIRCKDYTAYLTETIDFLPSQKINYTKRLVRIIIQLKREMTIQTATNYFNIQWNRKNILRKRIRI